MQTFFEQFQPLAQLRPQRTDLLALERDGRTILGEHGASRLGLSRAPSAAFQRIVATAGLVLEIIEGVLELPIMLDQPIELGAGSGDRLQQRLG